MKKFKILMLIAAISLCLFALAACGTGGMFGVPSHTVRFFDGETLVYETAVRKASLVKLSQVAAKIELENGYELLGFYDDEGNLFDADYKLSGDQDFFARIAAITYKITYDLGEGIECDNPTTYTVETPTFTLSAPYGQEEGLSFAGWTTPTSSTPEKTVTIEVGSTGDLTFKANFEDDKLYYLYFETFGGEEITRLENYTGLFDISGAVAEKSGYTFVNWYIDQSLTLPVVGDNYASFDKRTTLYAKYDLITYSINFENCDLETIYYTVESEAFTVGTPSREGHSFVGYTFDGLTTPVKTFTVSAGTHRDYTLTAVFEVNYYTLTFDGNGGSEVEPLTAPYGSAIEEPTAPERANCDFTGWYTDKLCIEKYTFTTMPASDITLYAGWYSDYSYTLKFAADSNSQAVITSSAVNGEKIVAGDKVSLSAPGFAYGGIFAYWSRRVSLVSSTIYSYDNELEFEMPFENLDLTAVYVSVPSYQYTVGGSGLAVTTDTLVKVFGNKISDDDYELSAIKADYLNALDDGVYLFDIMTTGGSGAVIIKVTGCSGGLTTVKLDYDINYPEVTLLFDGKEGVSYEYSLNASVYADCESGLILSDFNKRRGGGNSITVRNKDDVTDSVTLNKSAYNLVNEKYYTETFTLNGRVYDYVVEDYDEVQAIMSYFAYVFVPDPSNRTAYSGYGGGKATIKYYIEDDFRTEFVANEKNYVNYIIKESLPYYPSYNNEYKDHVEIVNFFLSSNELNTQRSTQELSTPSGDQKLFAYSSTRGESFDNFAIDKFGLTQNIRTLYELEALAFGVKPVFSGTEGQAYTVYQTAKSILRSIVDDSMNDYQKVIAIYDYLSLNVTYDSVVAAIAGGSNVGFGQYSCFTSYGALVEKTAVCDGISSALRLLCMIEGIECEEYTGISVSGSSSGGHAWNKVRIGGNWYGVDATWWNIKISEGTYVQHTNVLVPESVLYSGGHRERAEDDNGSVVEYPVEKACYGAYDYYDIAVFGADNVTRKISSRSELTRLVNYSKSIGANVIEMRNASVHSIETLLSTSGTSGSYATLDEDRKIYMIFLS